MTIDKWINALNKYIHTLLISHYKLLMWPILLANAEGTRSQIRYRHKEENGTITDYVSPVIHMEESLIRYRFMQQKTTIIYIDPTNKHNYFFDLQFLYR